MTTTSPDTEEEAKVAMDYTMIFYDYNVPVTIVLPLEAENATAISDLLGILPGGNETDISTGGNETAIPTGGNETGGQRWIDQPNT